MAKTDFAGMDLRHKDLRDVDLTDQALFQTDMRGTHLSGARISLNCATFDGVRLDEKQVAFLLLLIEQADIKDDWKAGIAELLDKVLEPRLLRSMRQIIEMASR